VSDEQRRGRAKGHRQGRSSAGGDRLHQAVRWTLELLAGAMVELTDHESLSGETVRRRLAKNDLKPWRRDM
jgi:hypothetical protein